MLKCKAHRLITWRRASPMSRRPDGIDELDPCGSNLLYVLNAIAKSNAPTRTVHTVHTHKKSCRDWHKSTVRAKTTKST